MNIVSTIRNNNFSYFLIMIIVSLILYLPFFSIQWDMNGIIEAWYVDTGGNDMFSPNHMLFRPVGFVIYRTLQLFGYDGNSAVVLQYITAISAALGVGFLFLALMGLTENRKVSMLASGLLAVSWSYWKFSTDIAYLIPATMFANAALALLLCTKIFYRSILVVGVLTGISILFFQGNIFLVPVFAIIILYERKPYKFQTYLYSMLMFLVTVGSIIAFAYILIPMILFGYTNLVDIAKWASRHGSDIGGDVPMWGSWGLDRLFPTVHSAVASFVPIWQGLGLRNLLQGDIIQPDKILPQLSLVALVIIFGATIIFLFDEWFRKNSMPEMVWLILGYVSFLPFIIWFDPFQTNWFIIPNVFLIMTIAKIWNAKIVIHPNLIYLLGGCITIIALANFTSTIWPYHSVQNPQIKLASCFTEKTTEFDTFIPTDWIWFGYAVYFFDYEGEVLRLMRGEQYWQENVELIEYELMKREQQRGSVYAVDINSYSQDGLDYFENRVGMPISILNQFKQIPAFVCDDLPFVEIKERKNRDSYRNGDEE